MISNKRDYPLLPEGMEVCPRGQHIWVDIVPMTSPAQMPANIPVNINALMNTMVGSRYCRVCKLSAEWDADRLPALQREGAA